MIVRLLNQGPEAEGRGACFGFPVSRLTPRSLIVRQYATQSITLMSCSCCVAATEREDSDVVTRKGSRVVAAAGGSVDWQMVILRPRSHPRTPSATPQTTFPARTV